MANQKHTATINVGGQNNYAALARDLQQLDSYTLRVIAAHVAAEQNRRTRGGPKK